MYNPTTSAAFKIASLIDDAQNCINNNEEGNAIDFLYEISDHGAEEAVALECCTQLQVELHMAHVLLVLFRIGAAETCLAEVALIREELRRLTK